MGFILAKKLKQEFYVRGKFYNLIYDNNRFISCRSVLEIIKKDKKDGIFKSGENPNAIFIMMNPGCSEPKDKEYKIPSIKQLDISRCKDLEFVEAKPDITQYQIMRIMKKNSWKYVKIINLSDYREANSRFFYRKIKELDIIDEEHLNSIFSNKRYEEFSDLLKNEDDMKVIVAWGVNEELEKLISIAISKPQLNKRIGLIKGKDKMYYYHPCPRRIVDKKQWLQDLNELINNPIL